MKKETRDITKTIKETKTFYIADDGEEKEILSFEPFTNTHRNCFTYIQGQIYCDE